MTSDLNTYETIKHTRAGGNVLRWHTFPGLRMQSVAAHSHGVAMICALVHPNPSTKLLLAALSHDLAEVATGDVPAHVKWDNKQLSLHLDNMERSWLGRRGLPTEDQLDEDERRVLAFADMFELMLYAIEEVGLGNTNMIRVVERSIAKIYEAGFPNIRAMGMFDEAKNEYYQLRSIHR